MREMQRIPGKYVAILSLASKKHAIRRLAVADLYGLFLQLREEFPDAAPPVATRELFERFLYTRLIGDEDLGVGFSLDESGGRRDLEIPAFAAQRSLENLLVEFGESFVRPLLPLAARFAALAARSSAPQA